MCFKSIPFFLFLLLALGSGFSQSDSLVLDADILGAKDIISSENLFSGQKILSASKTLKEVSDLPFTILIITKEEILKNGYTTLVDVLKMAPGIKFSQPGSATEGETFLMRGLKGNTYTKILVNGSPVKPFGVIGMPIGAQLPIRQADRIEIIYGPGAAIYGADANAGVINIIIGETDKPLSTTANLSIGNDGYTNVDVMFGGRFGSGNNLVYFNFYGSSTNLNTRNTTYDRQILYDPALYSTTGRYLANPNFQRDTSNEILVNDLPHESRLIGFSFRHKMFKIKSQLMSRKDHSALGLNPAAVSYANPLNQVGERIINSEVSIGKTYERFAFETKLGLIDFYINPQSNTDHVTNSLSEAADQVFINIATDSVTNILNEPLYDSLSQFAHNKYFSGTRYTAGRYVDRYLDQSFNIFLFKSIELTFGGRLNFNSSVPQLNFSQTPIYFEQSNTKPYDEKLVPFSPKRTETFEASLYSQAYLTFKKYNFIGGFQYYYNSKFGKAINPRFAIIYKPTPNLSFRAFYGEAFRTPSPFYNSNSYIISGFGNELIENQNDNPFIPEYVPEETKSYELGIRWSTGTNFALDANVFTTKTTNLISSNFVEVLLEDQPEVFYFLGYLNFGDSEVNLSGIQSNVTLKNLLPKENLSVNFNVTYTNGNEKLFINNFDNEKIKETPKVVAKVRLFYKLYEKLSFTTDHIFMSAVDYRIWNPELADPFESKGFYTLDVLMRFELNRHFNIYVKFNNVFSKVYPGLNATNTPDDLIFNPQELRTYRLGMNYNLN